MIRRLSQTVPLLSCLAAANASAQDFLNPLVVTASRSEIAASDAPYTSARMEYLWKPVDQFELTAGHPFHLYQRFTRAILR